LIDQKDDIHIAVWNKLKKQLESDDNFKMEMQRLYFFYERKLLGFVKTEIQNSFIVENFEEVVFSQYFQGYYSMKSILADDETVLNDSVWTMGLGFAKNDIPKFMEKTFLEESIDWTQTAVGHKFGIELLQCIEPAYDIYKQIRVDIANFGAYNAFIDDERYIGVQQDAVSDTLLGTPFDLDFLSPQVYMQAQYFTAQHELWDLFMWSSVRDDAWVGSVHLSTMPIAEELIYLLEIKLSNIITIEEKMDISTQVIGKLSEEIRGVLQTRLYHVENFDVLVSSTNNKG